MLKTSKRGQAIFEILPATVLFGIVVFASLGYYNILREQQMRLEAARNLAFAKINNSGPLTTVPDEWGNVLGIGTPGVKEYPVLAGTDNDPVTRNHQCFRVMAEVGAHTVSASLPWLNFNGSGSNPRLEAPITTWAVVYRQPGGSCTN